MARWPRDPGAARGHTYRLLRQQRGRGHPAWERDHRPNDQRDHHARIWRPDRRRGDQFYFYGRQQTGNFQVTVKATAQPSGNGGCQAGLMIRESTEWRRPPCLPGAGPQCRSVLDEPNRGSEPGLASYDPLLPARRGEDAADFEADAEKGTPSSRNTISQTGRASGRPVIRSPSARGCRTPSPWAWRQRTSFELQPLRPSSGISISSRFSDEKRRREVAS